MGKLSVTDEVRFMSESELADFLDPRTQNLTRLFYQLERARELQGRNPLQGSATALAAVIVYLNEQDEIPAWELDPLTWLLAAIEDLRIGRLPDGVQRAANRAP